VSLLARLKRLDACFAPNQPPPTFRCGWLTKLPVEYTGERHVAVVSRPPADLAEGLWEFEERRGPGPMEPLENSFIVYLTR
jgi:hypothetical protein